MYNDFLIIEMVPNEEAIGFLKAFPKKSNDSFLSSVTNRRCSVNPANKAAGSRIPPSWLEDHSSIAQAIRDGKFDLLKSAIARVKNQRCNR